MIFGQCKVISIGSCFFRDLNFGKVKSSKFSDFLGNFKYKAI